LRALLAITMGASFFLLPFVCYLATTVFVIAYLRRSRLTRMGFNEHWSRLRPVIRDPLRVATILLLSGIAMIAMIGGDFGLENYASTPQAAVEVLIDSFTNWNDPLSSRAIAVRGGVLIVLMSCLFVTTTLVSYFRHRWTTVTESSDRSTD
jgi:hypothetical protein